MKYKLEVLQLSLVHRMQEIAQKELQALHKNGGNEKPEGAGDEAGGDLRQGQAEGAAELQPVEYGQLLESEEYSGHAAKGIRASTYLWQIILAARAVEQEIEKIAHYKTLEYLKSVSPAERSFYQDDQLREMFKVLYFPDQVLLLYFQSL